MPVSAGFRDCDVVVVGGGPAGAASAARLAAKGFTTIVVDRATFPRDKVCGDFVGPAALAELADLGVTGTEAFGATNTISEFALHVDGDQLGALAIQQALARSRCQSGKPAWYQGRRGCRREPSRLGAAAG
jgi:2-polyprenyl-6-methoxyphenol hydroxylase-like FAD-dependent oxidoreductase